MLGLPIVTAYSPQHIKLFPGHGAITSMALFRRQFEFIERVPTQ